MSGEFDLEQIDRLLTTTRAVRKRLDLERPVDDEVLLRCIDLAEQAPSGGNQAARRWLVIRDAETKARLADLYREVGMPFLQSMAKRWVGEEGSTGSRVSSSALYLAENLERVPVLVVVTIHGVHDGSGRPGLYDSVLQSAWSFCLAARSRGLGTAWTTLHLNRADEAAELLGIPEGVTQVVLFPVAWTLPGEFHPVERRPAREVTYFDQWGFTHAPDGPGVTVEATIAAPAERVWDLVTDINLPARFSLEFKGAEWEGDGPIGVGRTFKGRNETGEHGHRAVTEMIERLRGGHAWEVPCTVSAWDPPREFGWNVGDPAQPGAQWRFTLLPLYGGRTLLTQSMVMGPGRNGTTRAIEENPDEADAILAGRRRWLRHNMQLTVEGIKALAETPEA